MSYSTQPPTKEQIAAARGHFFVKPDPPCREPVKRPLRVLKAVEEEAIARRRAEVYAHLPDMLPFFKELHEAGMIDGWRGVGEVEVIANEGVLPYAPTERKEHGID